MESLDARVKGVECVEQLEGEFPEALEACIHRWKSSSGVSFLEIGVGYLFLAFVRSRGSGAMSMLNWTGNEPGSLWTRQKKRFKCMLAVPDTCSSLE